jgi:hypothetical protein
MKYLKRTQDFKKKKNFNDEKIILFIIYREQVHRFFHRIEPMDNMAIYFSIHEHYRSIPSRKIEKKNKKEKFDD